MTVSSGILRWRSVAVAGLFAAYVAAVGVVFLVPVRRSDLLVFLAAGDDLLKGVNPYPDLGTAFLYSGHAFVYPWVAAVPFVPLAMLPVKVADVVFFVASVAAVGLAVRWSGARGWAPYGCVLAAATTIRGFQVGTLNAILLLCTVAAWRYRDRLLPVAAAVTTVVMSKVFLLPLAGWLAFTRRWRALLITLTMIGAAFGAGFLFGPFGLTDYLTLLHELSSHETHAGWSLNRLFLEQGADARSARLLVVGVAVALGLLTFAVWWRTRREFVVYAAAILGALLSCPIVWSHYLVLGFAPLLVARAHWGWLAGFAFLGWITAPPVGGETVLSVMYSFPTRLVAVQLALIVVFLVVCARARGGATAVSRPPGEREEIRTHA